MTDLSYTFDPETSAATFDAEFEGGRTIARDWAPSLRLVEWGVDSRRRRGAVVVVRHPF